ncbi:hemagglutinin/amebocyte aggregation factor-like [Ascaphus truei]|uniref:hemagglutinin/amebocyte aggregation factor-like n=1 Tax=Ascaphus truei TaxID=8439 RepID=UPI003F59AE04
MWDCLIETLNRLQNLPVIQASHSTVVMKVMRVLLLGLTAGLPENASGDGSTKDTTRVNNYNQPLNFVCPDQQSIGLIISENQDGYKDRVWDLGCKKTFSLISFGYWTHYVNKFNEAFDFTCPFGMVISGMDSFHNNKNDRRWKYYCCKGHMTVDHDCQWSEYVNGFNAYMRWEAPTDYYLVGIGSYYNTFNGDRRWKYRYCAKTKPR